MHDGLVPRAISRCPKCREPVSPFAAGCAICGTDLGAARATVAAKCRPQLSGVRPSDDAIRITISVLTAIFSPVMGALLTGYFAYDADRNGRAATRNLMFALLGFSLLGVFAYSRLWGGLFLGF